MPFQKGHKPSEDIKEKIRQKAIGHKRNNGRKQSEAHIRHRMEAYKKWWSSLSFDEKELINEKRKGFLGRQHTEESKLKMQLRPVPKGENHYNWKGGKSFEPYDTNWTETLKRAIRQRDGFACRRCGKHQLRPALDVHHIDYNKENCDPINLISLCNICHTMTNHQRSFWRELFKNGRS